jgi:replicative DNA helicase
VIIVLEELQYLNHWLKSKDPYFNQKHGIDRSYFVALADVFAWIEKFRDDTNGHLPTAETVATQFEDFRILTDLDNIDYVVNVLREQRAYIDYRPLLSANAQMVQAGKTIEAMWKMRNEVDNLLTKYTKKMTRYDWVKNALDRYQKYMEKHGTEGLVGLTTGIKGLDKVTGGWKRDDLILLAGRTNEGKSFVGSYFAYMVWRSLMISKINDPVIFISTEMPELEVSYRLDTLRQHFSNRALNEGRLKDPELYREYLEELQKKDTSFLILTQEANRGAAFTPSDIRAIIESERPAFMVIDQLYDLSDGTGERDIRKRIVNVANGIRDVNLYTQTPILLIAQAGRESAKEARKDPKASPELHQIQESDAPAQKATRVLTLRKLDDTFKISLKKNRGGERDKDFYMRADLDTGVWEETLEEELVF